MALEFLWKCSILTVVGLMVSFVSLARAQNNIQESTKTHQLNQ